MKYLLFLIIALTAAIAVNAQQTSVNMSEEPAALVTPSGKLYGTLELPPAKTPVPVVLIIAGSGPTDRNGNSPLLPGPNNAYKLLADELAKNGIASLRTDKRGVGESRMIAQQKESDLKFETYIDDAVLWTKQLRADKRFSTITIAGHSEGSLIGMVAAAKSGADSYISIAGAGRRIDKILLEQLKPAYTPELYTATEKILNELLVGRTVDPVAQPELASLFRPSVQPYMISWLKYDPAVEIAKLSIPVLILQGKTDVQISVADAELLAKAQPKAKLVLLDDVNHMLKYAIRDQASQMKAYSDPSVPIDKTLAAEVVTFVRSIKQK
ncbi:MAG: alpha/beta hydrolase [Pyrinomonadaceae bacterium]